MDPFMCVNCRKKTYSNVSDQVDRIVRVLRDAGYLSDLRIQTSPAMLLDLLQP